MTKNKTLLMSIGEAAKALGITRRIILNYESKGLLSPDKKDSTTSNRYYTLDTVTRMRTIRILQNLGLSLDDIYAYYNGQTELEPLITRLETLRDELNLNIEKLKERARNENNFKIQETLLPAQTIYRQTLHTVSIEKKKNILRNIVFDAMKNYGSDTSKRMFFIEYPLDDPDCISYCAAILSEGQDENICQLPEEKALCIFYHGSYESLPIARDKIIAYAKENGITLKNRCRHIYLEGPPQHKDPQKFITQVAIPIED